MRHQKWKERKLDLSQKMVKDIFLFFNNRALNGTRIVSLQKTFSLNVPKFCIDATLKSYNSIEISQCKIKYIVLSISIFLLHMYNQQIILHIIFSDYLFEPYLKLKCKQRRKLWVEPFCTRQLSSVKVYCIAATHKPFKKSKCYNFIFDHHIVGKGFACCCTLLSQSHQPFTKSIYRERTISTDILENNRGKQLSGKIMNKLSGKVTNQVIN